jgi:hypothetical protein
MKIPTAMCVRSIAAVRHIYRRDERGDVPGWLMITMMTIAVGMVIFGIFQDWVGPFVEDTLGQLEG